MAFRVPFPPEPFNQQVFHPAERDFQFYNQDNEITTGYLRRNEPDHEFAYVREPFKRSPRDRVGNRGHQRRQIRYAYKFKREGEGRYRGPLERVVIKKVSIAWIDANRDHPENLNSEVAVARALGDDECIVSMLDTLWDKQCCYVVMPWLGEDLSNTLQDYDFPNEAEFVRSWVKTLLYLQRNRIIHRDLSPENMIVHQESQGNFCPLIDFALALQCPVVEGNVLPITPQNHCGKWPYMSPEVFRRNSLDFGVDVWALGCMLFYFWTRELLYEHPWDLCWEIFLCQGGLATPYECGLHGLQSDPNLSPLPFRRAQSILPNVQSLSDLKRDLLLKMLVIDPNHRIAPADILQHPYFLQDED